MRNMFKHYVAEFVDTNEIIDEYIDGPYWISSGITPDTTSFESDGILYTTYWVEESDVSDLYTIPCMFPYELF